MPGVYAAIPGREETVNCGQKADDTDQIILSEFLPVAIGS